MISNAAREAMAKMQMVLDDDNVFKHLWWMLMPGKTIVVRWPRGWTELDHLGNQVESSDPNDHYRPWLENNVGRQGWDWDWKIAKDDQGLEVKFRKGKQQEMVEFAMRWD